MTGWQPQTVRAALSKLRRRGFAVRVAHPSDTATSRRVGVSRFVVRPEIRPSSDFPADTAQPAAPTQQLTFVETNRIVGVIVDGRDCLTWIRFSSGAVIKICDQRTAAARQWDMPSISPRWAEGAATRWALLAHLGGIEEITGGRTRRQGRGIQEDGQMAQAATRHWAPLPRSQAGHQREPRSVLAADAAAAMAGDRHPLGASSHCLTTGRRPTIARLE